MRLSDLAKTNLRKISRNNSSDCQNDSLRPARFDSFIGHSLVIDQLRVITQAALTRGEPVDGLLFTGPGGLGKTTLAHLIANEMGAPFVTTVGAVLNPNTLVKTMSAFKTGTIFNIDEIHGIPPRTREILYGAVEDRIIDCSNSTGLTERIELPPWTLVGATTNPGRLPDSMKDRFGLQLRLEYYSVTDIADIVERTVGLLNLKITGDAALAVADRSRGTPRVANSLCRRVRDWAQVQGVDEVGYDAAEAAFAHLGIDELGLDRLDRACLTAIRDTFHGGPIGLETLSLFVGDSQDTLRDDVEPYLVRLGLLVRTPRGRSITQLARQHLKDIEGGEE